MPVSRKRKNRGQGAGSRERRRRVAQRNRDTRLHGRFPSQAAEVDLMALLAAALRPRRHLAALALAGIIWTGPRLTPAEAAEVLRNSPGLSNLTGVGTTPVYDGPTVYIMGGRPTDGPYGSFPATPRWVNRVHDRGQRQVEYPRYTGQIPPARVVHPRSPR